MNLLKEKTYNATPFIKKVATEKLEALTQETIMRHSNEELISAVEKGYFRSIKKMAISYLKGQQDSCRNNYQNYFNEVIDVLEKQ